MGYVIVTRYHGPTNYRGSRVIGTGPALTHDGPKVRATVAWDYAGDTDSQYQRAAEAVAVKLRAAGWAVRVGAGAGAMLPDESGHVFMLEYVTAAHDAEDVLAQALTGPTSGAIARRLAAPTLANLARLGCRIVTA